ncbi:hypothetical protein SAMN05216436_11420 [bacterium A37T11]|nr:hypothetical protein SAMN05216436_11420 [bacterium A37T11]
MRKQRVLTDYSRYSEDLLATVSGKSAKSLTANDSFPNLPIPIADYTALADEFRIKNEAAKETGGKLEITARNNSKAALVLAMKQMAFYVNVTANGDANALASSGFVLAAPMKSLAVPDVLLWVSLTDGRQKGQFRLDFEPIKGAWEYEYQISSELDSTGQVIWGEIRTTRVSRGNVIAPVMAGVTYWVRVRARNGMGLADWSHTVSLLAR